MNILIDFLPFQTQGGFGGAASFAKAVYDQLSSRCGDACLFALYDSRQPLDGRYPCQELASNWNVTLLDVSKKQISEHIQENNIDVFFIAIGQFYARYDLSGIACKTIMFIHDIFDIERNDNHIDLMLTDKHHNTVLQRIKRVCNLLSGRWKRRLKCNYGNIMPLFCASLTTPYTVSDYSRQALYYYFPMNGKDIRICYSPLNLCPKEPKVANWQLSQLIESDKPYLLMIAANRIYKNPAILTKVFLRLQEEYPDLHLLTLKYGRSISDKHLDIGYLSDSDLQHAYEHAHALVFGSFFEGFGYPPIEAARYSTPTVASNVTSIPEILGDAGIYFSPFYPADLYRALKLVIEDRDAYTERTYSRYKQIRHRQESDMDLLIDDIMRK
ncbi:MAG: glycosyltransferase [Prevotella sp.]|nr:glycosyltransferase [Prevotella sp.]